MKRIIFLFIAIVLLSYIIPAAAIFFTKNTSSANKESLTETSREILVYDDKSDKVISLPLEEFLVGVVCAEMPASYEIEALKAQAVAARSYILNKSDKNIPEHKGASVCTNPAHCQAYKNPESQDSKWRKKYLKKIRKAVYSTEGEYLSYGGTAALACFSAVSSGKTESAGDIWGSDVPYLKSVDSSGDKNYSDFKTEKSISVSDFMAQLDISSSEIGKIERSKGGSVKTVSIGKKTFSGSEIRAAFSLPSANFTIAQNGDRITLTALGKGHGVGMSQFGANEMAKQGKKYTEILLHYYSNVTIEKLREI